MSGNNLSEMNATTFANLSNKLKGHFGIDGILRLDNTNLTITDSDPFETLSLNTLDISQNNLNDLNFTLLSKTLSRLGKFVATDCEIKNISEVIQHLGTALNELNLSGNNVGDSNGQTFRIGPDTFQHLTKMRSLNISYNHLSEFDAHSLTKHLRSLDVTGNDLKEIQPRTFSALRKIILAANQFSCEYLTELVHDWRSYRIIGEPWNQKFDRNCSISIN